eukprot:scaffold46777_cov32-Tisochrysis_lutea.AAC.4
MRSRQAQSKPLAHSFSARADNRSPLQPYATTPHRPSGQTRALPSRRRSYLPTCPHLVNWNWLSMRPLAVAARI